MSRLSRAPWILVIAWLGGCASSTTVPAEPERAGSSTPATGNVVAQDVAPDKKDRDLDGILDAYDACPEQPGVAQDNASLHGCARPVIAHGKSSADRDGDGSRDEVDHCPDEPEDFDAFEDEDGCPELDNDRDGLRDAEDQCPLEPEDKDGVQDEDGCPEPGGAVARSRFDADADTIPDASDKCPNEPEDRDGFQDADGCPDADNDRDGVPDASDLCPNDAAVTPDGCPKARGPVRR